MIKLFGEHEVSALADRNNDGFDDVDVLAEALDAASAEIDGYISEKYVTPVAAPSARLKQMACHIARYHLAGADGAQETDPIKDRYSSCIAFLRDVARGLARIPEASMIGDISLTAGSPLMASGGNVFAGQRRGF